MKTIVSRGRPSWWAVPFLAVAIAAATLPVRAEVPAPPASSSIDLAITRAHDALSDATSHGAPSDLVATQQAKLDAARQIAGLIRQPRTDPLDQAVALGQASDLAQARSLGLQMPAVSPRSAVAPPGPAVLALAARHGVTPNPEQTARIAGLDTLAEPTRSALGEVVDAFGAFETATTAAMGPAHDLVGLFVARDRLMLTSLDLNRALAASADPLPDPVVIGDGLASIDLQSTDHKYTTDFALLIDGGGSDNYFNNAGGRPKSAGAADSCVGEITSSASADPTSVPGLVTAAALIHLGNGSDHYGDPTSPRNCGANGGGYQGSGFLFDAGGDDTYVAGGQGTNGGGAMAGAGFLLDAGDSGTYTAGDSGTNGGAAVGTGLLVDAGTGSHLYRAGSVGVNGGGDGTRSQGFLLDAGGPGDFQAGSHGVNGGAGGPAGSGGLLLVGAGVHSYSAGGDGVNGGASNVGSGMLVDVAGDSAYKGGDNGVNGGGRIGSVGVLVDGGGNDQYFGGDNAVNGGATDLYATGVVVDVLGDDCYSVKGSNATNGGGWAGNPVGFNVAFGAGVGLLSDDGGYDLYVDPSGSFPDKTVPAKGAVGSQIDQGPTGAPTNPCAPRGPTTSTSSIPTSSSTTTSTSTSTSTTTSTSTSTSSSTTAPSTTTTTRPAANDDSPWVHEPLGAHPPARIRGAMARDSAGQVMLFGGLGPVGDLADTWTWDGTRWARQLPIPAPPARDLAAVAYRPGSGNDPGKVVLFGGNFVADPLAKPTLLADTWEWDGHTQSWKDVTPELAGSPCHQHVPAISCNSPPARQGAAMAQDAAGNLVLFGGQLLTNLYLGDTWTWDGLSWHQEQPSQPSKASPAPRYSHGMAYDAESGRTVLFGGTSRGRRSDDPNILDDDTWTWWDGTWHQEKNLDPHPSARTHPEMAYHDNLKQVVLVGGGVRGEPAQSRETWTWDGSQWSLRHPSQRPPPDTMESGAVYRPDDRDPERGGRVVMLSTAEGTTAHMGIGLSQQNGPATLLAVPDGLGDTWTWDGRSKGTLPEVPPDPPDTEVRQQLRLEPASMPADGHSTTTATATYTVGQIPVANQEMDFFADDSEVTFTPSSSCLTKANGQCSVTIHADTVAGQKTISVAAKAGVGDVWTLLTETPAACEDRQPVPDPGPPGWWGGLDFSFGCHGTVLDKLGPHFHQRVFAKDIALQPDGKILALTNIDFDWDTGSPLGEQKPTPGSYVARYKPDGTLDSGFGAGGLAAVRGEGQKVVVQPDGRVVALTSLPLGPSYDKGGLVSRLNADGSSDDGGPSDATPKDHFGSDGTAALGEGYFLDLALQRDDKLVVAGTGDLTGSQVGVVSRLKRDGTPDDGFGKSGQVKLRFSDVGSALSHVAIDASSGEILAAGVPTGAYSGLGQASLFGIARLLSDGTLDPQFNPCPAAPPCGGLVEHPASSFSMTGLALLPDGKILASGQNFDLYRYNPDGSADASFTPCNGGTSPPPCASSSAPDNTDTKTVSQAMAVQPDGRIVMVGRSQPKQCDNNYEACDSDGTSDLLVARFDRNGTLDDACGYPGAVRTHLGLGHAPLGLAVAVQPDGRILAGGWSSNGTWHFPYDNRHAVYHLALARYRGGGPSRERQVSAGDTEVVEPASGTTPATFTVSLDQPACEPLAVDYATADGSAKGGEDYTPTHGTLYFGPGEQTKSVSVDVRGDNDPNGSEQFHLDLSNPRLEGSALPPVGHLGEALTSPITLARPRGTATIDNFEQSTTTTTTTTTTTQPPPTVGGSPKPSAAAPNTSSDPTSPAVPTPPAVASTRPSPDLEGVLPLLGALAPLPLGLPLPPGAGVVPLPPAPVGSPAPSLSPGSAQQTQSQIQSQTQVQSALQPGVMVEAERQRQLQEADREKDDRSRTYLASARQAMPGGAMVSWLVALAAVALALAFGRTESAPAWSLLSEDQRRGRRRRRHPRRR